MDIETLLDTMTSDVYERLNYAVETGRWPEGEKITAAQREQAMQLIMLYQSRHNETAQHMTVEKGGEIKHKSKTELKREFSQDQTIISQKVNDS